MRGTYAFNLKITQKNQRFKNRIDVNEEENGAAKEKRGEGKVKTRACRGDRLHLYPLMHVLKVSQYQYF